MGSIVHLSTNSVALKTYVWPTFDALHKTRKAGKANPVSSLIVRIQPFLRKCLQF